MAKNIEQRKKDWKKLKIMKKLTELELSICYNQLENYM